MKGYDYAWLSRRYDGHEWEREHALKMRVRTVRPGGHVTQEKREYVDEEGPSGT
jgi:hypothetical protein